MPLVALALCFSICKSQMDDDNQHNKGKAVATYYNELDPFNLDDFPFTDTLDYQLSLTEGANVSESWFSNPAAEALTLGNAQYAEDSIGFSNNPQPNPLICPHHISPNLVVVDEVGNQLNQCFRNHFRDRSVFS